MPAALAERSELVDLEHAPQARVSARSRKSRILESLKRAYDIKGRNQEVARETLYKIFEFRDQAVHPPASYEQPGQHPTYGVGMERDSSSSASRTPARRRTSRTR